MSLSFRYQETVFSPWEVWRRLEESDEMRKNVRKFYSQVLAVSRDHVSHFSSGFLYLAQSKTSFLNYSTYKFSPFKEETNFFQAISWFVVSFPGWSYEKTLPFSCFFIFLHLNLSFFIFNTYRFYIFFHDTGNFNEFDTPHSQICSELWPSS